MPDIAVNDKSKELLMFEHINILQKRHQSKEERIKSLVESIKTLQQNKESDQLISTSSFEKIIDDMQQKEIQKHVNESDDNESDIALLDQIERIKQENKMKTEQIITMNAEITMKKNENIEMLEKINTLLDENKKLNKAAIESKQRLQTMQNEHDKLKSAQQQKIELMQNELDTMSEKLKDCPINNLIDADNIIKEHKIMELTKENETLQNKTKHEQVDIDALTEIFQQFKSKNHNETNDLKQKLYLQIEQSSKEQIESDRCHQARVDNLMKRFSEQIELFESENKSLKQTNKILKNKIDKQQEKIDFFDAISQRAQKYGHCSIPQIDSSREMNGKQNHKSKHELPELDNNYNAQNKMKILRESVAALERKYMSLQNNTTVAKKCSDIITIIGQSEEYKNQSMMVTNEFVQIEKQRFEYDKIWEIIECIEYDNRLWIMLTNYGAVNIIASCRDIRDKIICFIRSNPSFESVGNRLPL